MLLASANGKEPVIVKLARTAKVQKEVSNYSRVMEQIPGHFRPQLGTHEILWDLGAATYTFLGSREQQTFEQAYRKLSADKIKNVLGEFFLNIWFSFYSNPLNEDYNLLEAYQEVLGQSWLPGLIETAFDHLVEFKQLGWKGDHLPNPIEWIAGKLRDPGSIPLTLTINTHGDLHGDNLLVDENYNPWVIDFERTGRGPILHDFVELESDITNRIAVLPDCGISEISRLWVQLARPRSLTDITLATTAENEAKKALEVLMHLRHLAFIHSKSENAYPYVWGLLVNALFRAHLYKNVSQKKEYVKTLLQASILCHRLDNWDEPWPPEEWSIL